MKYHKLYLIYSFIWLSYIYLSSCSKNHTNFILSIKNNLINTNSNYIKNLFVFFKKQRNNFRNKLVLLSKNIPIAYPTHYAVLFLVSSTKYIYIYFIRKFKVFNKGRYSRTRQLYRTGVYWCLYLNILLVVALYFWFYRFTMNFGYMWWFFFFFFFYIVFARSLSYQITDLLVNLLSTLNYYLFYILKALKFFTKTK